MTETLVGLQRHRRRRRALRLRRGAAATGSRRGGTAPGRHGSSWFPEIRDPGPGHAAPGKTRLPGSRTPPSPFYQGPIPCVRAPPSGPSYLPKTPALNATAQGWSEQMDFGGHTVQAAGHHLIMPHLSSFTQSMRSRPPRPARGSRVRGEHGTLLAAAVPLRRIRAVFPASLAPLGWGRPRRVGC